MVFEDSVDLSSNSEIFFFSCVQSTNEPIKDIPLLLQWFWSLAILSSSLLGFLSLCLPHLSVLAAVYLVPYSPWHINHGCFKFRLLIPTSLPCLVLRLCFCLFPLYCLPLSMPFHNGVQCTFLHKPLFGGWGKQRMAIERSFANLWQLG